MTSGVGRTNGGFCLKGMRADEIKARTVVGGLNLAHASRNNIRQPPRNLSESFVSVSVTAILSPPLLFITLVKITFFGILLFWFILLKVTK